MATTCVTLLSFDRFDDCDTVSLLDLPPLYTYSALNWCYHTRKAKSPSPAVLSFLRKTRHVEASTLVLLHLEGLDDA